MRELRADLATAVRRAAAGEIIGVSVSGRRIAVLGPPDVPTTAGLDALCASGALIPPRRHDRRAASGVVTVWGTVRLDRALREVRG